MLQILDNGLEIIDGILQYAWFRLQTDEGEKYRCVSFMELASVPYDLREDPDVLGKQWSLLRGVYNASIDFVYSALGIYSPDPIGIVQLYGAAGEGETLQSAAYKALNGMAAVTAAISNFPQAQVKPPNLKWIEWYLNFVSNAKNILVFLGHPDPRASKRGLGRDGNLPDYAEDDLASEQNEILFRGLVKLREDFLYQVTAHHIPRRQLASGLVRVSEVASNIASRRRGAINIGFSLGIPILAALGQSITGSRATAQAHAVSNADTVSHAEGTSHTDSYSRGISEAWTTGGSETHTKSVAYGTSTADSTNWANGENWSHTDSKAHTVSQSHTDSGSHTTSHSVTDSTSIAKSQGVGSSWSIGGGTSWSSNGSFSINAGSGVTNSAEVSQGTSTQVGGSLSISHADTHGWNLGADLGGSLSLGKKGNFGLKGGISGGISGATTDGITNTFSGSVGTHNGTSVGTAVNNNSGWASSSGWSKGGSSSWSSGGNSFSSTTKTTGHAETRGTADTVGWADTKGTADTVGSADSFGKSKSWGGGKTTGQSFMQGESWSSTKSWAHTKGVSESWGTADSTSEQRGIAHTDGITRGETVGRGLAEGVSLGLSTGLVPGVNIGRSWQTEDDVADRLTEVLRDFEGLLNQATSEGGFMTDVVLMTASDRGAAAAEILAPQAFHGVDVPTPVLTIRPLTEQDDQLLRAATLAVLPTPPVDDGDPFNGYLWTRYATLLTAGQLAAYTAPGLVEEGTAVVTLAPTPKGLTFYPNMPGDVVLGHQFSPLTRDLTTAQVRLDPDRLFHTMFAADTGFGKTVAAMRLAYETTLRWHLRTVVLDFGAGWRSLLNAPGLEGHVDIRQLWPSAARPLRWNPLQIGRNINPEIQWRAFADIFGSVARLGVKRQKQELLDALRKVYIASGVLVDDPEVRKSQLGNVVDDEEAELVEAPIGTPLSDLSLTQRQKIAVLRSSRVGLSDLYDEVEEKLRRVPARDTMLTGVLEGILYRLNPLVQGAASIQFAPGPDTVPMEDLAKPWGVAIIEGGMFLDDFGKAFLLGWIGWHLYTDMVARRVHEVNTNEPILQIFFEEANKIFGGVDVGASEDDTGGISLSQRFGDMFRDARKYLARLHVITQAPSLIPQDIISSCNNLVVGFLKNPKDKDIVLSAIARSEKGFVDEPWRRFLSDLQIGMFIGRFPYAKQREFQQPFLFQPLPVGAPEPNDEEIAQKLGRIVL